MVALSATLAWLLAFTAPAATPAIQTQTWPIDATQSQVQFNVRKFWFAHVRGTFPALTGQVRRIDTRIGADLVEVDAELAVAQLEMDDPDDRAHAFGPEFFDGARYPAIRFESDPFPLRELREGGKLHGMLDLHGQRHPVTLALQPSDCPRQPFACVIRLRGDISRSAFGMRALRAVLSDKVGLDLRIRLAPAAPGA